MTYITKQVAYLTVLLTVTVINNILFKQIFTQKVFGSFVYIFTR